MVGMFPVQLKEVAPILENSEIPVRTMNLHAENFCQESRGSLDIFYQKVNPETRQVTAKFRGRCVACQLCVQLRLPDTFLALKVTTLDQDFNPASFTRVLAPSTARTVNSVFLLFPLFIVKIVARPLTQTGPVEVLGIDASIKCSALRIGPLIYR